MMLNTLQKRNMYLEKNKWTLIASVTASFASHLSKKFPSKSYATKQVKSKMRSLEARWRTVHKAVEQLRHNADAATVKAKKGKPGAILSERFFC